MTPETTELSEVVEKWTPGPWQAEWAIRKERGLEEQWEIQSRDEEDLNVNGPICLVHDGHIEGHERVAANAQLIATAPELYSALRQLIDEVERHRKIIGKHYMSEATRRAITVATKAATIAR